ncbi:MAG: endonuclease/exonuclease/phosphatase family protein [bacterium]|nr:endonuclease/exonuclease/phosphatase family protein [bacterium]
MNPNSRLRAARLPVAFALAAVTIACGGQGERADGAPDATEPAPAETLRVATFNIWELSREKLDHQGAEGVYDHPQLASAAEVIQRIRPDVLLLNEIDFDAETRENARLFVERYLRVGHGGLEPIDYPHIFFEPSNTGVPSGHDLDNDGATDGPADAHGFGRYPGQYAMALLSRYPIDRQAARTFQLLPWSSMPGHLIPDGEDGRPAWYDAGEVANLRLSSKSHWDVPIRVGSATLHVLASHPTPPVFDGEEDHNGRRNFDEVRLWADYLSSGDAAAYIVDDAGTAGGLGSEEAFVVMGDLNADPYREPDYGRTAISQLLEHPRIRDPGPRSDGGAAADRPYDGPGELRTAPYGRIDYVLPSSNLEVLGSEVFWPGPDEPLRRLVEGDGRASDHALVWVDLRL